MTNKSINFFLKNLLNLTEFEHTTNVKFSFILFDHDSMT